MLFGNIKIPKISLDLPIDDVVSSGVTSKEFTDMDNYIFKRVQN